MSDDWIQLIGLILTISSILLTGGKFFKEFKVVQFGIGIFLEGFAAGMLQNITMSLIFESTQNRNSSLEIEIDKNISTDVGSTFINSSYSFAQFIGPLLFGPFYQFYGFTRASVYLSFIITAILIFFIAERISDHSRKRKRNGCHYSSME